MNLNSGAIELFANIIQEQEAEPKRTTKSKKSWVKVLINWFVNFCLIFYLLLFAFEFVQTGNVIMISLCVTFCLFILNWPWQLFK